MNVDVHIHTISRGGRVVVNHNHFLDDVMMVMRPMLYHDHFMIIVVIDDNFISQSSLNAS
jgi:hypothetical protein